MATSKATESKAEAKPDGKKRYIVTTSRMVSADGSEVWLLGSEIFLDDDSARKHLAKGTVRKADETTLSKVKSTVKVNEGGK